MEFRSKALTLCALVALAACSSTTSTVPPPSTGSVGVGDGQQAMDLTVKNESDTCAWVTIYNSTTFTPWSIEGSPDARPRFLKRNESHIFDYTLDYAAEEIKVRAEMTNNADCSGGTRADVSGINDDLNGGHGTLYMDSTISGSNGNYSVSPP